MSGINLYVLLLASLSFSVALGKHNYFEEYFSKYHHHKSSSTTPSTSSIAEISPSEVIIASSQDDDETSFVASTMRSGYGETNFKSSTMESGYGETNFKASTMQDGDVIVTVVTIFGSIIFVILLCCCFIACCKRCDRTESIGYVVGTSAPPPVIIPAPHQPAVIHHLPPEYTQEPVQQFPSQHQQPLLQPAHYAPMQQPGYQYPPMQQQHQYSPVHAQAHYSPVHPGYQNPSTLQFYNPPEAPPPYETKALQP